MDDLPQTNEILERLAAGESLRAICATPGMPNECAVRRRVIADEEFATQYAHARRLGLEWMEHDILRISDECRIGDKTEKKQVAWECEICGRDARWRRTRFVHSEDGSGLCEDSKPVKILEEKTISGDMIERARLQVDSRKWLLSKLRPDKYGDAIKVEHSGQIDLAAEIRKKRAERGNQPD